VPGLQLIIEDRGQKTEDREQRVEKCGRRKTAWCKGHRERAEEREQKTEYRRILILEG
jgi:hypothetical protein